MKLHYFKMGPSDVSRVRKNSFVSPCFFQLRSHIISIWAQRRGMVFCKSACWFVAGGCLSFWSSLPKLMQRSCFEKDLSLVMLQILCGVFIL